MDRHVRPLEKPGNNPPGFTKAISKNSNFPWPTLTEPRNRIPHPGRRLRPVFSREEGSVSLLWLIYPAPLEPGLATQPRRVRDGPTYSPSLEGSYPSTGEKLAVVFSGRPDIGRTPRELGSEGNGTKPCDSPARGLAIGKSRRRKSWRLSWGVIRSILPTEDADRLWRGGEIRRLEAGGEDWATHW